MKNKKGFTLIELLAVIVILAVIALIATPIIMNVINDAKKGAAKDSTYGYVKAVELASTQYIVKNGQPLSGNYTTKDGNLYNGSTKVLDVTVNGTKPVDNGSVTLNKGFVTKVELTIGGFKVKYNGDRVTIGGEDSTNPTPKPTEESSEPKSFAEDSWDTIVKAVQSGSTSNYHVGDTKEIDLGELGTHMVRIANMSSDDPVCSNSSYSQTACGFVVEFADVITRYSMGGMDVRGWPASDMRTYINYTIYNVLPEELRNGIIDTRVVSGHGPEDSSNFISTDKLYLLSTKEVWNGGTDHDTAEEETRQLDYYIAQGVTIDNYAGAVKNDNGSPYYWWLRSVFNTDKMVELYFFETDTSGRPESDSRDLLRGVSPAFRIG